MQKFINHNNLQDKLTIINKQIDDITVDDFHGNKVTIYVLFLMDH